MFKSKIRALRKAANMTQQQFADLLKIDRSTYSGYESGKSRPSAQQIKNIAKIHCVTVDSLLDDTMPVEHSVSESLESQVAEGNMKYESAPPVEVTLANLSRAEQMLVANFRLLDENEKEKLFYDLDNLSSKKLF